MGTSLDLDVLVTVRKSPSPGSCGLAAKLL